MNRWWSVNQARSGSFRFATQSDVGLEWSLKRNCSVTPAQLAWLYASLCLVSLGVAVGFWSMGATLVLPFAALEVVTVGLAFLVYARHAADAERIRLVDGRLVVELETAGRIERCEFAREWVRVEPQPGDGQMIEVRGGGRSVRVGRFVRSELRSQLAGEIRFALRGG
ncbi:DUF2244 domain-containing protein [Hydrogenophaga sp.]|uniref:DUF2244 domain-containing protein n=1 Tax=Hydrogenophaga sp. TaxID=1904254 RepID=UPI002616F88F|nr:DUF2244 domain-containing protein [Hydrogenophaga sp.]MCW5653148.1 DUF2244 domain-containing protein [Hydrogenophaga sp.]